MVSELPRFSVRSCVDSKIVAVCLAGIVCRSRSGIETVRGIVCRSQNSILDCCGSRFGGVVRFGNSSKVPL